MLAGLVAPAERARKREMDAFTDIEAQTFLLLLKKFVLNLQCRDSHTDTPGRAPLRAAGKFDGVICSRRKGNDGNMLIEAMNARNPPSADEA